MLPCFRSHRPDCLFALSGNGWGRTIEIYSKSTDRGSQDILHTYKCCVSCIHNWFPYLGDSHRCPIWSPP